MKTNKKEVLSKIEKYFRQKFQIAENRSVKEFTLTGLSFDEYCKDMMNFYNLGAQAILEEFYRSLDMTIFEAENKSKKENNTLVH